MTPTDNSLLQNPFFWSGQIGLLAIIIFCHALIELRQDTAKRSYIYALWALSGLALWCMGTPLTGGHPLPAPVYMLEFGIGAVFALGYFQVRGTPGLVVPPESTTMLRRLFLFGGIGGFMLICGVSFIVAYQEQKALAQQLLDAEERRRKEQASQHRETIKAIVADTAIKSQLRGELSQVKDKLDSTRKETARAKAEREALMLRTKAQKKDIEALKKAATRSGRQLPPISPIKTKDTLQNEVKKGFFRRLFGHNEPDSTGTVARQY